MNEEKQTRGKSARVVRVTISTVKARKILAKVTGCGIYAKDELLRDVYLAGIRDIIGQDLGYSFRRAVLTGDIKQVARFCSDGWRVIGCDAAKFTSNLDGAAFIRELRRLCEKALTH